MSESVIFRGAMLRNFDLRQGKEGASQVFVRLHVSADYNEQICEAMDWDYLPDCALTADLAGSLSGINFILTPGDKLLKQYELNFDISSVEDFKLKSKKAKGSDDDDSRERHLEFVVLTPKDGVEAFLGQYIRRVGRHEGQLKIGYTVQQELPLNEAKAATAEPEDDEADTHEPEASTLASAREAAGGTHARKRREAAAEAPVN